MMVWERRSLWFAVIWLVAILNIHGLSYVKAEEKENNLQISRREIATLKKIPKGEFDYCHGFGSSEDEGLYFCFQNVDGSYTLCTNVEDSSFQILEATKNKVLNIQHEGKIGGFTKDENGQYFVFFSGEFGNQVVYELCKYDENGQLLGNLPLTIYDLDSVGSFDAGDVAILARNGKIAVYFGRLINSAPVANSSLRHQGSCYFIAETDTMSLLSSSNLVSSHSFNNVITYDEQEEQFIFLDRGDGNPNGYLITKEDGNQRVVFPFKGGVYYSEAVQSDGTIEIRGLSDGNTYSQLAGLLSFQDRYVLVGTYENKTESTEMSSRNLFIQLISKDLKEIQTPIYLTDYNDQSASITEIGNPKVVQLDQTTFIIIASEYTEKASVRNHMYVSKITSSGYQRFIPNKTIIYKVDIEGKILEKKTIPNIYLKETQLPHHGMIYYNLQSKGVDYFTTFRNKIYLNRIEVISEKNKVLAADEFIGYQALNDKDKNVVNIFAEYAFIKDKNILQSKQITNKQFVTIVNRFLGKSVRGNLPKQMTLGEGVKQICMTMEYDKNFKKNSLNYLDLAKNCDMLPFFYHGSGQEALKAVDLMNILFSIKDVKEVYLAKIRGNICFVLEDYYGSHSYKESTDSFRNYISIDGYRELK